MLSLTALNQLHTSCLASSIISVEFSVTEAGPLNFAIQFQKNIINSCQLAKVVSCLTDIWASCLAQRSRLQPLRCLVSESLFDAGMPC